MANHLCPVAIVSLVLVAAPTTVQGHGHLTSPVARNGNFNGAAAGGPGTVHAFGPSGERQQYQHGLCGNAVGTRQTYNAVGEVQATYRAGDTIEVDVLLMAHHVGYFEVDLCVDASNLSEECFDKHHLLLEGCTCECEDSSNSCEECNRCRRYWKALMQGELAQFVTRGYAGPVLPGAGNIAPYNYKMFYVLPSGVRSSNAVLRWHYMTTNSCTNVASAPEEFWNCADIAIQDESASVGPAIRFDNDALESKPVPNLIPAISSGDLKGVNFACPVNAEGDLLGVGAADEYYCGRASESPGPYEYCSSAAAGVEGGPALFDCFGIPNSAISCLEECGVWFFQCANDVPFLRPVAPGVRCRDGTFVLEAACDGFAPEPDVPSPAPRVPASTTPAPAPPTPAPAPPTPTPGSPSPEPSQSPSQLPGPADPRCAGHGCRACFASNGVCYNEPRSFCDRYPAFAWCGDAAPPAMACTTNPRCAEFSCSACLANNNVCYSQPQSWCDAFPEFLWCGDSSCSSP